MSEKNKDWWMNAMLYSMMNPLEKGYMQKQIKKNLEVIPRKEFINIPNDGYHTIEGIIMPDGTFIEAVGGHMQTASAITDVGLEVLPMSIYGPIFFCVVFGMVFTQGTDRVSFANTMLEEQQKTIIALQDANFMDDDYHNMYDEHQVKHFEEQYKREYKDNSSKLELLEKARQKGWL